MAREEMIDEEQFKSILNRLWHEMPRARNSDGIESHNIDAAGDSVEPAVWFINNGCST